MREYLFKGKRKDNGEWVCGYYEKYNGGSYINLQTDRLNSGGYPIREFIEVIPETVGQYTGLTDKNSKKIFEGDIVKWTDGDGNVAYDLVDFKDGCFVINAESNVIETLQENLCLDMEVVGPVYDNPELLEVR